jgi:transglutaminase-like putative cysteine protease
MLAAREFCFESPLVPLSVDVRAYAEPSFRVGRPLVDAVAELIERIFEDFVYDPGFTTVTTPLEQVLGFRRGVCQDFAHLAIGCLRSMGLAARYVSGYLETAPPPGEERMIGADASHAWPSVFIPGWGWLDVDPTNDRIVGSTYVTTAWGRDYSDVSPLKGIVFGGGHSHTLDVSVDVARSAAAHR